MRTGRQEPTFSVTGDYAYSFGEEAVEMFEEDGGATFYPSQKLELTTMLARNEDGSPAAVTIGISKPRQNGKSYAARYYAAYMGVFEHRNVLYSAHHSTTTNKMFKALCDLFESPERYPDFANDVKSVSHVRGYEGIYFNDWIDADGKIQSGGCIEFATRTNSGSRGGTYSVIVIDEAQEMTRDQQEAMLPVVSAASEVSRAERMPQQIFIGTPPGPTCHGTVFADMYLKAHSTETASDAWWLEWAVKSENIADTISSRQKALEWAYETNPAMGYRIAEKIVLNEFDMMSLDGYARERLGWWAPTVSAVEDKCLNAESWAACASDAPKPEGKTGFGVRFAADGSEVFLAGAVVPEDGPARITLIERRPTGLGTKWLSDWLAQRYGTASCVVIDGRNGVDVLIERLSDTWKAKGSVIRTGPRDVLAAVSTLTAAVDERALTWYRQQTVLNDSALSAVKRPLSGGWAFGGDDPGPIEACSLALWGAKTSKRDPSRKMRIG